VASAEYADLDWKTAMEDLEAVPASSEEVVEDFDAELEAEDAEGVPQESEALSEDEPPFDDTGGAPPETA
jgi:hypothetical protein